MTVSSISHSAVSYLAKGSASGTKSREEAAPGELSKGRTAEALTNITNAVGPAKFAAGAIQDLFTKMFTRPIGPPDNVPENQYAQVLVNGEVVATLYNTGGAELTNDAFAKIGTLEDPEGLEGPELAQWRAGQYAAILGGTIRKASTALTQQQWDARPPREYALDVEAMNAALQEWQSRLHARQSLYIDGQQQQTSSSVSAVDRRA